MTAPRKTWYLIAYDVRDPKRLRRVHYALRKQALAVQQSVFIVHTDRAGLDAIERGLRDIADEHSDDLRRYAIPGPGAVWAAGQQGARLDGMHGADGPAAAATAPKRWWKSLFGREAA